MIVFFYGLFMDEELLRAKGITPDNFGPARLPGYRLRIGARATLQRDVAATAHGILMQITQQAAHALYTEDSVADYMPEAVITQDQEGLAVEAICFNLPADKLSGHNPAYARDLLRLAERLDLPQDYLAEIRAFSE